MWPIRRSIACALAKRALKGPEIRSVTWAARVNEEMLGEVRETIANVCGASYHKLGKREASQR